MQKDGIIITGHAGKWHVIDQGEFGGEPVYLLEHDTYGDGAASLIVNDRKEVIMDDVWNGLAELDSLVDGQNVDTSENPEESTAARQYPSINESMSQADRSELLCCLIDVVEDWLEEKGFTVDDIPNSDREGAEGEALIYSDDYDYLADRFAAVIGIKRYCED